MNTKRGRKPILDRPNRTASFVLFEDQMERIERRAAARRLSQSQVLRDILDGVFGLDIGFSDIGNDPTKEKVPA